MKKWVLILVVVVVLAGLAVVLLPRSSIAPAGTGITGTVMLGPTCPVMRDPPDPQCADKPFATKLVLTSADQSRVIKEFSSSADGTFTITAAPGEYAIRSAASANILPRCGSTDTIKVTLGTYATANVSCDTGIR